MKQKLCYVDPVYFIEHDLNIKSKDKNSAYFDLFPDVLIEDYCPLFHFDDYAEYVASGKYDNLIFYDVFRNDTGEYNILMYSQISESPRTVIQISILYTGNNIDKKTYNGLLAVVQYDDTESQNETILKQEVIFFDTFNDLMGITKNVVLQYLNHLFNHDGAVHDKS